jgi:Rad3-related DNA helicase
MTHESPQTKGQEADKQEQQLVDSIENLKKIIENLEQNKSIDGENQINDIFKRSFLSLLEKINEENPDKIKELYQKITKTLSNTENTIASKERQSLEEIEILLRPYSGFQREIPIPAYKETGRKEIYNEKEFISNAKDIVANAEFIPPREKERIMLFLNNPTKENIQNLQKYIL